MSIPICQVDAFTANPFAGNPACVVFLDAPAGAGWMQSVAAEMNLSETAFLHSTKDGWNLRWFTPTVEVKLCGHATLASAHALWDSARLAPSQAAVFHTASGQLTCVKRGEWIEMDFPALAVQEASPPTGLVEALGARPTVVCSVGGPLGRTWLVELDDEAAVRAMKVDFAALALVPGGSAIVTAAARTAGFDFVSRFFCPAGGVEEDPVTGSAHCALAPYWAAKLGKQDFSALQVSRRGGVLQVRLAGDRVKLSGQAVTVFRGELIQAGHGEA